MALVGWYVGWAVGGWRLDQEASTSGPRGSRIKDQGGRLDPEAGTSGPRGSRIKDLVLARISILRRDTDVILRQSKGSLELFNSS